MHVISLIMSYRVSNYCKTRALTEQQHYYLSLSFSFLVGAKVGNTVSAILPVNGASYIRWGHIYCPNSQSKLIYSGRMGGSYYSAGGAYNPQCFPDNPKYLITRAPALVKFSGGEYEI